MTERNETRVKGTTEMSTWTQFMDMHSGGGTKEQGFEYIYIEATQDEAGVIFYNRFGHSPSRVSCTCCGEDYSISSGESLAQLTGYDRNCRYIQDVRGRNYKGADRLGARYIEDGEPVPDGYTTETYRYRSEYVTLDEYLSRKDVLVVRAEEIKPEERKGAIPAQGYVWMD